MTTDITIPPEAIGRPYIWQLTNDLRFVRKVRGLSIQRILQQKWQCLENGAVEWIDVPEVNE